MNLLQQLCTDSFSYGNGTRKGILTLEEAKNYRLAYKCVDVVSSMTLKVFFFTDIYGFGCKHLPKHFVCSSTSIPMSVVPRPGFEDGMINTVEKYVALFEAGNKQISSIEELVALMDKQQNLTSE